MRNLLLLLSALATITIGFRYWSTLEAQKSGPFAAYAIDLTNYDAINRGLLPLTEKLLSLRNGDEAVSYVESLGFRCKFFNTQWKIYNSDKKIEINYDKYASCGYWYGFWGEELVSNIYLDKANIVLHAKSWVSYTEY